MIFWHRQLCSSPCAFKESVSHNLPAGRCTEIPHHALKLPQLPLQQTKTISTMVAWPSKQKSMAINVAAVFCQGIVLAFFSNWLPIHTALHVVISSRILGLEGVQQCVVALHFGALMTCVFHQGLGWLPCSREMGPIPGMLQWRPP